jgi:hypothetical protein
VARQSRKGYGESGLVESTGKEGKFIGNTCVPMDYQHRFLPPLQVEGETLLMGVQLFWKFQ